MCIAWISFVDKVIPFYVLKLRILLTPSHVHTFLTGIAKYSL